MDCFSRYCFNKQKQLNRSSNPPINNIPINISNGLPPISRINDVGIADNNSPGISNIELEKNLFNNINGYSFQNQSITNQEITQKIVGWAEEKTQKQKKLDKLGQTIYIIQIGKFNPQQKKTTDTSLSQWAVLDLYNQMYKIPRRYSIPMTINSRSTQNKFPDPFIRYKLIPSINQTMAIDVTTQNNPEKKLTRGNLIVWNYHGGPNQHFYIRQANRPQAYYIVSLATGFVLTAQNQKDLYRKEVIPVTVNPHEERVEQLWRFIPEQYSTYIIQPYGNPSMALDLYKGRASNDTPVVLWEKTGKKNQRWIILSG